MSGVEGGKGPCYQWKEKGQCSKGDQCSFRHVSNDHAQKQEPKADENPAMFHGRADQHKSHLSQLAERSLERVLDAYPADDSGFWTPPDFWDAEDLASEIGEHPCVWTDGSGEDYPTGGFEVAGAGVYLPAPELAKEGAIWGTVEENGDGQVSFWCAILAVQAFWPGHSGIDYTSWRCRPSGLVILELIISMFLGPLVDCWTMAPCLCLYLWLRMVILSPFSGVPGPRCGQGHHGEEGMLLMLMLSWAGSGCRPRPRWRSLLSP